jgi:hypothetical protein
MEKLRISIMEMFKAMKNRQNEKGEAFAPQTSMLLTHGGGWKGTQSIWPRLVSRVGARSGRLLTAEGRTDQCGLPLSVCGSENNNFRELR